MNWEDNDNDGKQDNPDNGMVACTFTNPQTGATFVTFRGTPDGAWVNNAKMLLGELMHCKSEKVVNGDTWNYLSPAGRGSGIYEFFGKKIWHRLVNGRK